MKPVTLEILDSVESDQGELHWRSAPLPDRRPAAPMEIAVGMSDAGISFLGQRRIFCVSTTRGLAVRSKEREALRKSSFSFVSPFPHSATLANYAPEVARRSLAAIPGEETFRWRGVRGAPLSLSPRRAFKSAAGAAPRARVPGGT